MTTFQCPKCPSAAFCGCETRKTTNVPYIASDLESFPITTVPATVQPESLAALEQRLAKLEERYDKMRVGVRERGDAHQRRLEECEKRLETLYKAHEVDRREFNHGMECIIAMMGVGNEMDLKLLERLTALEQAASQQPSRKPSNRQSPARGRSRTKASTKARGRGGASRLRTRASSPKKR